jgi:streptogramin lyase
MIRVVQLRKLARVSHRFALLLVLSALVVAGVAVGVAVGSRGAGGLDLTQAANAGCKKVGWIAQVHRAPSQPHPRLAGVPKGCACPGGNCSKVAKGQWLFANETMLSGGGRITFKSVVKGVPNLTCIVARNSQNVIYPQLGTEPNERAVLRVVGGATSCQVEQGDWTTRKNAVFLIHGTKLTVIPLKDPVFGMKAVGEGSLIQVKKGTVRVGSKAVARNQQVVDDGSSVGAVTPLDLDPVLKPALCALTPELRLTDVRTASGARPGGNPIGLAPDRFGYLWFTDDATPAIGRYNMKTRKITYPNNGGVDPDSVPRFIIADTTGMIWFTDAGATPAIGKIDPRTRKIVEYDLPPGSIPWNPAYDPVHKLVWFTDQRQPTGAIGSLDPKTGEITLYTTGLNLGSHPQGIVVDRRGNVWFTDDNDPRPAIGRLDGTTHVIEEYESGLVEDSLPRGITIDPAGRVWFADQRTIDNSRPNAPGDGLIGMIDTADPKHEIVEYAVFSNGGNRRSIPQGLVWYRGFVWFTDDGGKKAIGRIDPTTGAITESSKNLVANSQPIGIVVAKGALWFTDRSKSAPKIGRLTAKPSC